MFTDRGVAIAFSVSEGITEVTSNADSDDVVPKSAWGECGATQHILDSDPLSPFLDSFQVGGQFAWVNE